MTKAAFAVYSVFIHTEHSVFHKEQRKAWQLTAALGVNEERNGKRFWKKCVKEVRDASKTLPTAAREMLCLRPRVSTLLDADELYTTTGRGWYTN